MLILVLNCGGTSIKYRLIDMESEQVKVKGVVNNIGAGDSSLRQVLANGRIANFAIEVDDHSAALQEVLKALASPEHGALQDWQSIQAVGHRVVQGGEKYRGTFFIDDQVLEALRKNIELAPLHNPANILGIEICQELMPGVPQVVVFDNAFHKDLPDYAFIYGLPYEYYEKYGIRRYGFHGISFKYMTERAADILGIELRHKRVVSLMLGSGTTVNAMAYGRSIDVSTGLTPSEGLIQSTRSGDVDPAALTYLMRKEGLTPEKMEEILNRKSGWLGISGVSNNLKRVEEEADRGNYRAQLALEAFAYRCKKYIGAYAAAMGGLDLLIFAGGAGENSARIRAMICAGLQFLGIALEPELNGNLKGEGLISGGKAATPVLVVNTDEEMVIAREAYELLRDSKFE